MLSFFVCLFNEGEVMQKAVSSVSLKMIAFQFFKSLGFFSPETSDSYVIES